MERISVGLVPVHIPRLTDPIAPCMGFVMQAEVVKGPSKFDAYRKAQRKAAPERERTGLKNPKEGYSSHLGYEAEVLRYAKLFRFPCGYLTILHLMAV